MFNRFKSHFTRQTAPQAKSPPSKDRRGYFRPQSADELLATTLRRQCLRQLWENSALPDGLYQRFYLTPIRQLLSRVQQVPATREGDWSGSGGFIDLTLKFTTYSVRLAKGHLLPPGAAPETQATQSLLWQAVVFWAALFYHLPLLQELEGELEDGHGWQPGLWTPDRRFRFRFRSAQPDLPVPPLKALLAARLLPEDTVSWLFLVPEAWRCLALHLGGQPASVPLIDTLLQEAAGQVQSPLLKSAGTSEIPDIAEEELSESGRVSPHPPLEAASAPEPSGDTDTLALLSLFQSGQGSSHQQVAKNDHHGSKLIKQSVPEKETVATQSHLKTLL
ncbi:TraI domain-containing protein [Xenorhabdus sp. DI]|uniref:TraI domain-containing protein n=1 Tax=Xenorhabdus doucetiae TaxID=351671 RepID=UPI0019AAF739|nr:MULTISPECIES: TraI domain-containing protein [unclassified Xenorhabdus]MBD2786484.1 TraI domain-containing protein [Xenorhabdus sp. 3]MBD2790103.1 TraI domain-containing protein [Xenorhabdus sp. DI]